MSAPGTRRTAFRRLRWAAAALVAFLALWYLAVRLTSPGRAVVVEEFPATHSTEPPSASPTDTAPPDTLRLGVWNIAHGRGQSAGNFSGGGRAERQARLDAIARLLAGQDLDVVVLNEVDFNAAWSHGLDQAAHLARAAGYPHLARQTNYDLGLPGFRLHVGNAVLSRYPLADVRRLDLPGYSRVESLLAGRKCGLVCTLELPGARRVRLLAVHLEHRSEAVRLRAAEAIEKLRGSSELPLISAGDFNSAPPGFPRAEPDATGRTALSLLLSAGFHAPLAASPSPRDLTFPSPAPDRVLDWILIPAACTFADYRVLPADLSDHLPVVAQIELPRGE